LFIFAASLALAIAQLQCGSDGGARPSDNSGRGGAASGGAGAGTSGSGTGGSGIVIRMDAGTDSATDGGHGCDGSSACVVGCGNGKIDPGSSEQCDDGNNIPGDGCSTDCKTEKDWACPEPGAACVSLVKCGDGKIGGKETCDDGNTKSGDGCSSTCTLEPGWDCARPGGDCIAHCGDAILTATEQCDPPNPTKGCSLGCRLEPGYACDPPASPPNPSAPATCHRAVCGDGTKEATEACDDGGRVDGDGCSGRCTLEPICDQGECTSKCGDGIRLPAEACDDGNTRDGDGCSADCKVEPGYTCTDWSPDPPDLLTLAVTFRDFISFPANGAAKHPDFETFSGHGTKGLVLPQLDPDGKPDMEGRCSVEQPSTFNINTICPDGQQLTTRANFKQWYRDTTDVNFPLKTFLLLSKNVGAMTSFVFDSDGLGFFPLDGKGWTAPPVRENTSGGHDFGFTTELRYFLQYRGGESLEFSGDDDVWVFVNRKLAIDLGGLHSQQLATLNLDASSAVLGIAVGHIYEVTLFHAERKTDKSNFKLTLTGFTPTGSTCKTACGDGIVAGGEQCDLGAAMNTGDYGGCTADCKLGPSCGDGVVQAGKEVCDDGSNLAVYAMGGSPGCAPGCVWGGYCGDGKVDSLFGEQCDLGRDMNVGGYNGCTSNCLLGPRCGDGILQPGEQCDDGNTVSGDGCTQDCLIDVPR
jgi:fibro-slime domain-containing protein